MANFTSAQFRSLIDALNLIENVIETAKSDDQEVTETLKGSPEEIEKLRKDDEEVRAYHRQRGHRMALRQHEDDRRKEIHQAVDHWVKSGKNSKATP